MRILTGKIVVGVGDLSSKMQNIPELLDAYEKKTGMRFFPGSLNIQLNDNFSVPPGCMRLEKEEYGGKVSVNIVPCKTFGIQAFILRTDKNESGEGNHPKTIIEVACDVKLREKYHLHEGDVVNVELNENGPASYAA